MGNYNDLEVYKTAFDLAVRVHKMTMKLPKYEMYEQGSQIRRSSKSIKDTIAEGYGRRKYKADLLRFLVYALASCDETMAQLEMINQLHHRRVEVKDILEEYRKLGKQINKYIQYVQSNWRT